MADWSKTFPRKLLADLREFAIDVVVWVAAVGGTPERMARINAGIVALLDSLHCTDIDHVDRNAAHVCVCLGSMLKDIGAEIADDVDGAFNVTCGTLHWHRAVLYSAGMEEAGRLLHRGAQLHLRATRWWRKKTDDMKRAGIALPNTDETATGGAA